MRARMIDRRALAVAMLLAGFALPPAARSQSMPPDFVRLVDVAPDIRQDMRYAGPFNFTGAPVPGYEAPQCILWKPAAEALARAQQRLQADGYSLKVFDCYRPARAVAAFAAWSKAPEGNRLKSVFFPDLDKSRLFALGYIASRSRHSLGIAVDVGLVLARDADLPTPESGGRCDGTFSQRARETSLDFGTSYDCFSERSATRHPSLAAEPRAHRGRLVTALEREGFRNYSREWWHFEFASPAAPTRAFDFPVR